MRRFFCSLGYVVRRLWLAASFWLANGACRVTKNGRLLLHVHLRCEGDGRVILGAGVSIGYILAPAFGSGMVRLQARGSDSLISVGDETSFSNNVQVIAEQSVTIGSHCLIGDSVLIFDSDFHHLSVAGRHRLPGACAPVVIEDNVFVGSRSIILKGVTIGRNSVIGAGSVVTSSIPPGVIAAGNPAKVVRQI